MCWREQRNRLGFSTDRLFGALVCHVLFVSLYRQHNADGARRSAHSRCITFLRSIEKSRDPVLRLQYFGGVVIEQVGCTINCTYTRQDLGVEHFSAFSTGNGICFRGICDLI